MGIRGGSQEARKVQFDSYVDFVLFADGSKWGEDAFRESKRIQGLLSGVIVERQRLRSLLATSGTDALISDIRITK
jgi:hypothetical protein